MTANSWLSVNSSLSVLKSRGLGPGLSRLCLLHRLEGKHASLLLPAAGRSSCGSVTTVPASVFSCLLCVSPCSALLIRRPVIPNLRGSHLKILNNISRSLIITSRSCKDPFFPDKVTFTDSGWTCLLGAVVLVTEEGIGCCRR